MAKLSSFDRIALL